MIEIILNESQYNELAKEGSLMIERKTVSRGKPKHKHNKELDKYGPLEVIEGSKSSNFNLGCGIKAGDPRHIRWQGWRPGDDKKKRKKAPIRGGIDVTALSVAYCQTTGLWEVTFIKQMQSVPTVYLARGMGHTQNASEAIQDAGQVPYDEGVAAMLDDEREGLREKRIRDAGKRFKKPAPEPEPEHTAEELDSIERKIAEGLDEALAA
jgi:hypothetical protein